MLLYMMPESIGQQLKRARREQNLSLEKVFEATHLRIKYLEALEADDFSVMPSPVQGRGFLRLYGQHLGLEIDALLEDLRQAEAEIAAENLVKMGIQETEGVDAESVSDVVDVDEADPPFWTRLLERARRTLASFQPASGSDTESAPETDASPISEPVPVMGFAEADEQEGDIQFQPSTVPDASLVAFAKIGAELRERREMLSLTHDEIEQHTHVRVYYLQLLEAGAFDDLPSPVQTRGLLSNYASFLDLDAEAMLLRFAEGLQARRLERHPIEVNSAKKTRKKFAFQRFVAPDLIFGVGMIVSLIAFSIWGVSRIAAANAEDAIAVTAPSISDVLLSTPTAMEIEASTPTAAVNTPLPELGTETVLELAPGEGGVQLFVRASERTWMRVIVDGEIVFEGRVQPSSDFLYEGIEQVEILTGNAAALRVTYNQRDMGLMGSFGEVVDRIYGVSGILTPTITPTLLATATPTATITPSPTQTATATEASE